jgi:cytosine/adenosine deaminase-related metal-dependent hydrolase
MLLSRSYTARRDLTTQAAGASYTAHQNEAEDDRRDDDREEAHMSTRLIRNATLVATMDDAAREIPDGSILIEGTTISQIGAARDLPTTADDVIDARGMVVLPGLVNTHHHFYQTLTRAIPQAQNAVLFDWLKTLYPIWAGMTPEAIQVSTKVALAELLLSGCTTASDHTYIWPNGSRVDDQIEAAAEIGRSGNRRADFLPIPSSSEKTISCVTPAA